MEEKLKCPDCAELILRDANKCRFCGRAINEAVRQGYPSFYKSILQYGFTPDRVLDDYANHVEEEGANRLNTESLAGNLLTWGQLNTFDQLNGMQRALFDRAFELIGKKGTEWASEIPSREIEELFESPGNKELKAVYLCGRHLTGIRDFGKSWRGKDIREDPEHLRFAIGNLEELIDLCRSAYTDDDDFMMTDFVQQFEGDISDIQEQLDALLENGRTSGAEFREEVLPNIMKDTNYSAEQAESRSASQTVQTPLENYRPSKERPVNKGLIFSVLALASIILGIMIATG